MVREVEVDFTSGRGRAIKMSKSINAMQTDKLVKKMQENQEIARGFVIQNTQKFSDFWKQLTLELNSVGPPVKSEFQWKKVWANQKLYVQNKVALNNTQKFTPTKQAIFQPVGMKETIEGVSSSTSFGLNLPRKRKLNDEQNESRGEVSPENNADAQKRKTSKISTHDAVIEKLHLEQRAKLYEAVKIMRDLKKEIRISFQRININLDRLNMKKEAIEEKRRHHIVMENYKKIEIENTIETNRRMNELQKIKIEIMREKKRNL